jgi:hypothetical protein
VGLAQGLIPRMITAIPDELFRPSWSQPSFFNVIIDSITPIHLLQQVFHRISLFFILSDDIWDFLCRNFSSSNLRRLA